MVDGVGMEEGKGEIKDISIYTSRYGSSEIGHSIKQKVK